MTAVNRSSPPQLLPHSPAASIFVAVAGGGTTAFSSPPSSSSLLGSSIGVGSYSSHHMTAATLDAPLPPLPGPNAASQAASSTQVVRKTLFQPMRSNHVATTAASGAPPGAACSTTVERGGDGQLIADRVASGVPVARPPLSGASGVPVLRSAAASIFRREATVIPTSVGGQLLLDTSALTATEATVRGLLESTEDSCRKALSASWQSTQPTTAPPDRVGDKRARTTHNGRGGGGGGGEGSGSAPLHQPAPPARRLFTFHPTEGGEDMRSEYGRRTNDEEFLGDESVASNDAMSDVEGDWADDLRRCVMALAHCVTSREGGTSSGRPSVGGPIVVSRGQREGSSGGNRTTHHFVVDWTSMFARATALPACHAGAPPSPGTLHRAVQAARMLPLRRRGLIVAGLNVNPQPPGHESLFVPLFEALWFAFGLVAAFVAGGAEGASATTAIDTMTAAAVTRCLEMASALMGIRGSGRIEGRQSDDGGVGGKALSSNVSADADDGQRRWERISGCVSGAAAWWRSRGGSKNNLLPVATPTESPQAKHRALRRFGHAAMDFVEALLLLRAPLAGIKAVCGSLDVRALPTDAIVGVIDAVTWLEFDLCDDFGVVVVGASSIGTDSKRDDRCAASDVNARAVVAMAKLCAAPPPAAAAGGAVLRWGPHDDATNPHPGEDDGQRCQSSTVGRVATWLSHYVHRCDFLVREEVPYRMEAAGDRRRHPQPLWEDVSVALCRIVLGLGHRLGLTNAEDAAMPTVATTTAVSHASPLDKVVGGAIIAAVSVANALAQRTMSSSPSVVVGANSSSSSSPESMRRFCRRRDLSAAGRWAALGAQLVVVAPHFASHYCEARRRLGGAGVVPAGGAGVVVDATMDSLRLLDAFRVVGHLGAAAGVMPCCEEIQILQQAAEACGFASYSEIVDALRRTIVGCG